MPQGCGMVAKKACGFAPTVLTLASTVFSSTGPYLISIAALPDTGLAVTAEGSLYRLDSASLSIASIPSPTKLPTIKDPVNWSLRWDGASRLWLATGHGQAAFFDLDKLTWTATSCQIPTENNNSPLFLLAPGQLLMGGNMGYTVLSPASASSCPFVALPMFEGDTGANWQDNTVINAVSAGGYVVLGENFGRLARRQLPDGPIEDLGQPLEFYDRLVSLPSGEIVALRNDGSVRVSCDVGKTFTAWGSTEAPSFTGYTSPHLIVGKGGELFATREGGGIQASCDRGQTWESIPFTTTENGPYSLVQTTDGKLWTIGGKELIAVTPGPPKG